MFSSFIFVGSLVYETEGFWEGDGRRLEVKTSVVRWTLQELANRVENAAVKAYETSGGEETR